ncbi:MAG: hypothetical protein AAGG44_00650 [Planctomycetota bacterium]
MSKMKISEAVIDELVAGTLEGQEYRDVLDAIERHPEGWKQCAMAFLEEQAFEKDLGFLAAEDRIWSERPVTSKSAVQTNQTAAQVAASNKRLEWMSRLTSIAALLLIAFTIGWFGAGLRDGAVASSTTGASTTTEEPGLATVGEPGGSTLADGGVIGGEDRFDGNLADYQFIGDNMVPVNEVPRFVEQLERSGNYRVDTVTSFVKVEEGNEVRLVPVQQLRVQKKSFSY